MIHKYIAITTIAEIDLSKIGLSNINNRYIDAEGNRYATRFNLRTHKIEIVQIVLGKEEARITRENYLKNMNKQGDTVAHHEADVSSHQTPAHQIINMKLPVFVKDLNLPIASVQIEEIVVEFPRMVSSLTERLKGILNNMKISQVFNDHKAENGQDLILEVMSLFDHRIMEVLESANDKLVELLKYPRPPTSYLSSFTHKQKEILDTWSQSMVMELIKAVTAGERFFAASETALNLLKELDSVLLPETIEKLSGTKKQQLTDAKNTCEFVKEQILQDMQKILGWWKAVYAIA